jgi:hypothetical protein
MKRILLILALAISASSLASAAPLKVNVLFPQGLIPGKETTIKATVEGDGVNSVQGAPLSVIFDGRQNAITEQVDLGPIGGKLEGKFTPGQGPYRVSVRFRSNGRNYAFAYENEYFVPLPQTQAGAIPFDFKVDDPNSSSRLPVALLGWFAGAIVLGLVALRSKQFLF